MNDFERHIQAILGGALQSLEMKTLQVNMGLRCNQACRHCHLASSPDRPEMMEWPTMELVLEAAEDIPCGLVDLTGGAPELNPYFRLFVNALRRKLQR